MRARRTRRLTAVALVAVFGALLAACDDPPTTKATTVVFNCQATPGGTDADALQPTYEVTAPQAVKPGTEYTIGEDILSPLPPLADRSSWSRPPPPRLP